MWFRRISRIALCFLIVGSAYSQTPGPSQDELIDTLLQKRPSNAFFITDEKGAARKLLYDWEMDVASRSYRHAAKIEPTAEESMKLFRACQRLGRFRAQIVPLLPQTRYVERKVYEYYRQSGNASLEPWLRRHTGHLRAQLIEAARSNEEDLRVLAQRDWMRAERLISRLRTSPSLPVRINAAAVLFEETGDANALKELLDVAYDKQAPVEVRDTAVRSLLARAWEGREDCFLRLLGDKSLSDGRSRRSEDYPLLVVRDDPDKWVPLLTRALETKGTLRDHAVRVLVGIPRVEALRPLLPWLQDREWSESGSWKEFVGKLGEVAVPAAEDALLYAMQHFEDPWDRAEAAESMVRYPSSEHIPLLLEASRLEESPDRRKSYVTTLLGYGYFSIREQVEGELEYAKQSGRFFYIVDESVRSDQSLLGEILLGIGNRPSHLSTEELIKFEVSLIPSLSLEKRHTMERVLVRQGGPLVERYLVDSLKSGKPSALVVTALLEQPETFRSKYSQELIVLSGSKGAVSGIASALAQTDPSPILTGKDQEAQKALLAAARTIGVRLPVSKVGPLLQGPTKEAAEAYLMALDTEPARRELLASSSEKPIVFGRAGFVFETSSPAWESELANYLQEHPQVDDIYCVRTTGYYGAYGNFIVLVSKDKVELRHSLDTESYEGRHLTAKERHDFLKFVAAANLDDPYPPPGFDHSVFPYGGHGPHFEFLHLNRQQGRRQSFIPLRAPFRELFERLQALSEVDMQPHNALLELEPEATVIFDGTSEKVATRLREWNGKLYLCLAPPETGSGFVNIYTGRRITDQTGTEWKVVAGSQLIEAKDLPRPEEQEQHDALTQDQSVGGRIRNSVTSPDGRFRAVEKSVSDSGEGLYQSMMIDLKTGKMSSSELAPAAICTPVIFLRARDAFLVYRAETIASEYGGRFYLQKQDGTCVEAEGDLAPLLDALTQPLQRRSQEQYWVAASDDVQTRIGVLDAASLKFHERAVYPNLSVTSSQIWVDESTGVVYVVVGGDLVRIPLRF